MARPRNEKAYESNRARLLDAGEAAFRTDSFAGTGINDVLAHADVPKGSFYHYFPTKEAFGIAVARQYHERQLETARTCFADLSKSPIQRLRVFFETARDDMRAREFTQGCLMCNLTTELADQNPSFQAELETHWRELVAEVTKCVAQVDLADIGLAHLTALEASDWLMNAWSGALTRMKATRDDTPLALFLRATFRERKDTP